MKSRLQSIPIFIGMLGLIAMMTACAAKPTSVAKKYFTALEERDYEAAKKFVAPGSITNFNRLFDYGKEPAKQYTVLRFEQSSDHQAKVYYTEDGGTEEHYVELMKVDGEWMIDIPDYDDYDK